MKNKIDTSRQKTPWDDVENITPTQSFIMKKYKENYNNKHPKLSDTEEYKLINSIVIVDCPYCCSSNIKKNGKKNKIQKYYCKNCKKEFNPLTNTIFDNHKISITEWVEFCLDIFYYGSTTLISKVNKNSVNTSIYWLHKLFLILDKHQENIMLTGDVYLDETFYKVITREIKKKANGKEYRGLSQNQYCIGIACDSKYVIAFYEGRGKPSKESTEKTFINHIEQGSKLIHDKEKSHKILVKKLSLISEVYDSKILKNIDDKQNPLNKINRQCDLLKKFLNTHSGFDREDLQNYLNLFSFMNSKPTSKLKKVDILLNIALTTRVTLRYRDLFKVKENDG